MLVLWQHVVIKSEERKSKMIFNPGTGAAKLKTGFKPNFLVNISRETFGDNFIKFR